MFTLPNRPQDVSQTVDSGLRLYVAAFRQIVGLALLASLTGVIQYLVGSAMTASGVPEHPASAPSLLSAGALLLSLLMFLVSLALNGAIIYRLGEISAGRTGGFWEAGRQGFQRLPALFGSWLLYALIVGLAFAVAGVPVRFMFAYRGELAMVFGAFLAFLVLLLPGLIWLVTLSLYVPVVMLEGCGPFASLKRSHHLAWGHWWRATAVYSIPSVILLALYVGAVVALEAMTGLDPLSYTGVIAGLETMTGVGALVPSTAEWVSRLTPYMQVVTVLAGTLVTPLFSTIMVALYSDLRLRKEGGDSAARVGQWAA